MSARVQRALRRLAGAGAVLAPIEQPGTTPCAYGVFARGDRRTRALSVLNAEELRSLIGEGAVAPDGPQRWRLTREGHARLARNAAGAQTDAFRSQHQERGVRLMRDEDGIERQLEVNHAEAPLTWLARRQDAQGRRHISAREFEAGQRLYAAYRRSTLPARTTSDWTSPPRGRVARGPGRSPLEGPERALAARESVGAALQALGPGLRDIVYAVVLEERPLDVVETRAGWPRRSGKVVLKLALSRLADHYGLGPDRAE